MLAQLGLRLILICYVASATAISTDVQALPQSVGVLEANSTCKNRTYFLDKKPFDFASTISELKWLGGREDEDKYVFAIAAGTGFEAGGELYKSDYYGSHESWKNITEDLPGLMDRHNGTTRFLRGAIAIHNSRENPEKIFVQGAGPYNWISDDFGSLWHVVDSPGKTWGYWTQLKMHPFKNDWMLALVRRRECSFGGSLRDKWCASDLFLTQDFGNSWTNLTENSEGRVASFVDFDWGVLLQPWSKYRERPADTTIFATAYEDPKHMKGPLPAWDKNVHYIMSQDFFKSNHEKIASCGNKFDILAHRVYLAIPNDCPYTPDGKKHKLSAEQSVSTSVSMFVSNDEGTSFSPACLPIGDLDLGYSMVGNFFGEGAFLAAHHSSQDRATARAPVANIYSSGTNSSLFSLSLGRAFRRGPHVDFVNVEGLPGIYLANFLGLSALEDAAFRFDKELTDYEKYVKSMVSYNGGAHWELLKKPKEFNYPRCDTCSRLNSSWECQLHLHGPSSWHATEAKMPSLHSHGSAPGLVMAVGNVGQFLDMAADATCTYLSRDGGETWTDIADHASVFDFGDSGGIMAMVRHQTHGPASYVKFSMDEGKCWHTIELPEAIDVIGMRNSVNRVNQKVEVMTLRVEPTASSNVFLIHGKACAKSEWHPTCSLEEEGVEPLGKLYAINFKELMGDDWRICGDDEYEKFSLPTPERCLLGRNVSSTRRKADSECFNGKGWQREQGWEEYCNCTSVDVECDFGYEWSWWEQKCMPMPGVDVNTCPDVREHKYIISQSHLRLLNGDACANVSRVINDTDGRGHSTLPGHGIHLPLWAIVAIALLAAIAVIAGAATYMQKRTPSGDAFGSSSGPILTAPFAAVGGAFGWIKDKIPGLRSSGGDENYFQPLSGNNEDFDVDEEDAQSPVRR